MWRLAFIPFVLQAISIALDEGVFHIRRGLPKWERIGHPIDTLSVLVCMLFVLWVPFSPATLKVYIGLAVFSSILVTKDEFVHKHHCPWIEHWLHSLLFLLHPITLASAGLLWPMTQGHEVSSTFSEWMAHAEAFTFFLQSQAMAMALFLSYQIIFWNILWKDKPVLRNE